MPQRTTFSGLRLTIVMSCCLILLAALAFSPVARTQQQTEATATFSNSTAVVIADADAGGPGVGSLYPSPITVSGLSGTITSLTVTLNGLTHTWPDDLALLLVGPNGQSLVLQSDVGGSNAVTNLTYTIADSGSSTMPDNGTLTSGTFRPTSILNDENFPIFVGNPAPPTSWSQPTSAGSSTLTGILGGTSANGVWKLYVIDQFIRDTGSFTGGWSITVNTNGAFANSDAGPRRQTAATPSIDPASITASFSNSNVITLTDATSYAVGQANPYPSSIAVSGMSGTITDVRVTLINLTHTFPDDLGFLLVGPTGAQVVLQSDVGGSIVVNNLTYTFDDSATSGIPNSGPIASGSYKPTSVDKDNDLFPTPAPSPPYNQTAPGGSSTLNGVFSGTNPNGPWKLFAVDNFIGNSGAINGGWTLQITTNATAGTVQLSASSYTVGEGAGSIVIPVTRSGDTSTAATVDYATTDGTASHLSDYNTVSGTLSFAAGETSKTITVFITDDVFVEGNQTFSIAFSNPSGATLGSPSTATVTITDNDASTPTTNPIDAASFYVRQHYVDFFNREPDVSGLGFWTNEITGCGTDSACIELKRINVSAAFYLSIEFQQSGYLVYRTYGAAFGTTRVGGAVPLTLTEFLPDLQRVGNGVVVGASGWETQLEANKVAYLNNFVARSAFTTAYPSTMTNAAFVDALNANAGGALSASERNQLVTDLTSGAKNHAQTLRAIVENTNFTNSQFNKAFVLTQYFGYLRRNPYDSPDSNFDGYNFWLNKLNGFNGNFVNAEMVKAFINSTEYRSRFGP